MLYACHDTVSITIRHSYVYWQGGRRKVVVRFEIDKIEYQIDIDWLEMISIQEFATKKKAGDLMAFSADYYGIEIYPYTL